MNPGTSSSCVEVLYGNQESVAITLAHYLYPLMEFDMILSAN